MLFLTISSKQKTKNCCTEYYLIFLPFKTQVSSKHSIFLLFDSQNLLLYLRTWLKVKVFSDNSNLTNSVDVQSLHENDKWVCVPNRIHSLFKKQFCCFTLLYWNISFIASLKYLRFSKVQQFLLRLPRTRSRWFPCYSFPSYLHKKSKHKKNYACRKLFHNIPHVFWKKNLNFSIFHRVNNHKLIKQLAS